MADTTTKLEWRSAARPRAGTPRRLLNNGGRSEAVIRASLARRWSEVVLGGPSSERQRSQRRCGGRRSRPAVVQQPPRGRSGPLRQRARIVVPLCLLAFVVLAAAFVPMLLGGNQNVVDYDA